MKITEEQLKIIDQYSCERLCNIDDNRLLIDSFSNDRNKNLARTFKENAWEHDTKNFIAYYIIKSPKDIALYFSLKSGMLFTGILQELLIERDINIYKNLINKMHNNKSDKSKLKKEKEILSSKFNIPENRLYSFLSTKKKDLTRKYTIYKKDRIQEKNRGIVRVVETFSAVELAHFCTNDNAQREWKSFSIKHTLGEVMFWNFIVPKIYEIQKNIGCQYLYLFAADNSKNRTLINYYTSSLKFKQTDEISTIKPLYDFNCEFMYQEIESLYQKKEDYFNHFNEPDIPSIL